MTHPDNVEGWNGSLKDLAKAISRLKYNKVQEFLIHLAEQIEIDSKADEKRERKNLAANLYICSHFLYSTALQFGKVWGICKKHMGE